MAESVQFKPELWKPLDLGLAPKELDEIVEADENAPRPVKSFFDSQEPGEAYEVRGILPRAELAFPKRIQTQD